MISFKQYLSEESSNYDYVGALDIDQQKENPLDRTKLQRKVQKAFAENPAAAFRDPETAHASYQLFQHMDLFPDHQKTYLSHMDDQIERAQQEGNKHKVKFFTDRRQFLTDRMNVNKKIRELHNDNPTKYKDVHGNPLSADPVKDARDPNKFPGAPKEDVPQSSTQALSQLAPDGKYPNPIVYDAVKAAKAKTQPSFAVTWPGRKPGAPQWSGVKWPK